MAVQIVSSPISLAELQLLAEQHYGDFVKAVVDVQREVMAIGGDLHADEETVLLESGGQQRDLWGINLYPGRPTSEFVEFDSMINVRPAQGNRSRGVEDAEVRGQIERIVERLVAR
jgi:hypothetical protein